MTTVNQATEPVYINSSRPRMPGPAPRVLTRRDDYYMLPRSPRSPTLHGRMPTSPISGSMAARRKKDYVSMKVSEMEVVEPFVVKPSNYGGKEFTAMTMDLTKAPAFVPSKRHTSAFSKLRSLDLLPAQGLSEEDFWSLFSRCRSCQHFMTTRTIPYHRCPAIRADFSFKVDTSTVKHMYFLWLLDAHNVDRATGVPADVFRAIFYICAQCGRYMTRRVSFDHHDDSDDWDSENIDVKHSQCIYLRPVGEPS